MAGHSKSSANVALVGGPSALVGSTGLPIPLSGCCNQASLWLLRQLGIEAASEAELAHSEEGVALALAAAQWQACRRDGPLYRVWDIVLNALDHAIISGASGATREVMRPRKEIVVGPRPEYGS